MKSLFIIAIASFSILSCNSPEENPNESITKKMLGDHPEMDRPAPAPTLSDAMNPLLIGKWQVDSSGFINNGVPTPLDAPLADSFWEFTKEGKLIISGNVSHTTDIHIVNNAFTINMMGVDCDYRIKSVNEKTLVLVGTIMDTKDMKMESVSIFKRLK